MEKEKKVFKYIYQKRSMATYFLILCSSFFASTHTLIHSGVIIVAKQCKPNHATHLIRKVFAVVSMHSLCLFLCGGLSEIPRFFAPIFNLLRMYVCS